MDLGLKGLKAVLAGASKGIGRATTEVLAAEGCDVALCARGREGVDKAIASLKDKRVKVLGEAVDIGDAEAYKGWVMRAAEQLGGCDIFISFGSAKGGPATEESFKGTFTLDLMGTFRGIEAAQPYLERSKAGSIVVLGSTAAFEDFAGPQAYNALKAGVINYAHALSQSLAPKGIRVNIVSPGPTWVDGGDWEYIKGAMPDFFASVMKTMPMGRMAKDDEVARTIAFVASPACRAMTGTNIVVDAGFTKRVQY